MLTLKRTSLCCRCRSLALILLLTFLFQSYVCLCFFSSSWSFVFLSFFQVTRYIEQVDVDGDGQLDLAEFMELVRRLRAGDVHEGPLEPKVLQENRGGEGGGSVNPPITCSTPVGVKSRERPSLLGVAVFLRT